jgi:acetate kinase
MAERGRTLILNAGSSTLKWSILATASEAIDQAGTLSWSAGGPPGETLAGILPHLSEVDAVGHRVVHGGARYRAPVLVSVEVRADLGTLVEIDPLHAPPALAGIDAVSTAAPALPQVAAFDTAFHATLPDAAACLPLPWAWSARWQLRRYGFHGLSVAYAVRRTREMLGALPARLIVAHLGSGCSLTAVAAGRSVDTTMGFTPLDGVMMATRPGALDPGVLLYLMRHGDLAPGELESALEKQSGLLGICGSGDFQQVLADSAAGNARAALAYSMFEHSLQRALGALTAVLGGLDALVFTGGIGEHSARLRAGVSSALRFAGLELDPRANEAAGPPADAEVSSPHSAVKVLRIAAREDLSILAAVREVRAATALSTA